MGRIETCVLSVFFFLIEEPGFILNCSIRYLFDHFEPAKRYYKKMYDKCQEFNNDSFLFLPEDGNVTDNSSQISMNASSLTPDQESVNNSILLPPTGGDSTTSILPEAFNDTLYDDDKRKHLPKQCGMNRFDGKAKRIIEGDKAALGQFPFMIRMGLRKKDKTIEFDCGGALISRFYAMSAAHCNKNNNIIRLGENYLNKNPDCNKIGECAPPLQDIEVKSIRNPDFCKKNLLQDFTLVELKQPATFNDFVMPICLPSRKLEYKELMDKYVTIIGWGAIQVIPRKYTDDLMHVDAPIIDKKNCSTLYNLELLDSQLCIGYVQGKDSCSGDSGGPVVKTVKYEKGRKRWYLIGVVSYGLASCGRGPAIYTDVSFFLNWALDRIDKS